MLANVGLALLRTCLDGGLFPKKRIVNLFFEIVIDSCLLKTLQYTTRVLPHKHGIMGLKEQYARPVHGFWIATKELSNLMDVLLCSLHP